MKVKLLFFSIFILGFATDLFGIDADHFILPTFYNKDENKFYGLFAHYNSEWNPISIKTLQIWSLNKYKEKLKSVLQNYYNILFKGVGFNEHFIYDHSLRSDYLYIIPVTQFVPANVLNQLTNDKIDGFAWVDFDEFIGNTTRKVNIDNVSYDFSPFWSFAFKEYIKSDQAKNYMKLMETIIQEQLFSELTSSQEQTQSLSRQPQKHPKEDVNYPSNIKAENKFLYDAYYNAPNALRRDIEIAKNAGTLNTTIFQQGVHHTPLTYALYKYSDKSSPETIEILLRNGVDPNIPDSKGFTPLYYAVTIKHDPEIIRLLLDYGANPRAVEPSSETKEELAAYNLDPQARGYGKPLIDLETREDVRQMLQSYRGGIKKPITKPSVEPAMQPPYGNDLENKMQQLKDSLKQLEQGLMR